MTTDRREHWENFYRSKAPDAVSWHAPQLATSLALLRQVGLHTGSRVIDVGAGASTLVRDVPPPTGAFDLWHDRAVLHFLIEPADAAAYSQDSSTRRTRHPGARRRPLPSPF
ncbi:MAG: hypothetical protein RLZZ200_242 [Pseudomonadota bacterium]|jgi:hypothetical protein